MFFAPTRLAAIAVTLLLALSCFASPLTIYDQPDLQGTGTPVTETYTVYSINSIYSTNSLPIPGGLDNKISSFQLDQGYAVVVAADPTGMHPSKTYVAAEAPITVNTLPAELDNTISFIRIVPWRDVTKKGHGGGGTGKPTVDTGWYYNWQLGTVRGQEVNPMRGEYVPLAKYHYLYTDTKLEEKVMPMDQVTHVLGLNEPDKAGAQAAENFFDITNVTVCLSYYDDLQKTGLRMGAPVGREEASNNDTSWFSRFYNEAKDAGVRMDVIPLHWYDYGGNPGSTPNENPQNVLNRLAKYLSKAYHRYDRTPLWLTEFNANTKRVADVHEGFVQLALPYLEGLGYVERYAYFGSLYTNDTLSAVGQLYKDHVSTIGFTQNILPPALTSVDVGSPSEAGTVIYSSHSDTYTVCGNGAGTGGTADEFHFVYETVSGDCEIVAKVASMVPWSPGTQAGVMIRESLAAGSAHASMLVTRSNGGAFESRTTTGGTLASTTVGGIEAPYWVKLVRAGNLLTGYTSPDGVSWTAAGSQTISMSSVVKIGLMSATPSTSQFSDAVLTDVTITGGPPPNQPPIFTTDPISKVNATEDSAYNASISYDASDPENDAITFSKISGPNWLSVATNGILSGIPGSLDIGPNSWTVQASDGNGGSDTATLNINVIAAPVILVGGSVKNGDFNANPGAEVTFANTPEWYNLAGAQTTQCTRDNITYDTSQNGVLVSGRAFGVNTGHVIAEDDVFDVSYVWRDAFNWVATGQISVSLFVTDDDTLTGVRSNLVTVLSGTSTLDNTYEPVDQNSIYTAGAGDAGKTLFLVIETTSVGFARLDNVELLVIPPPPNHPPAFTADPISKANATEDSAYGASIIFAASDPEGDPLTFSKVSGPPWLSVAANGTLSGTPTQADVGPNAFVVQVDATGGSDTAALNITVDNVNDAPVFTVDPINETIATEGVAYSGSVANATDEDGDTPLTYSKASGADWLNVAADGSLSGTPGSGDVGNNVFSIQVIDGNGGADEATLNIEVIALLLGYDAWIAAYEISGEPAALAGYDYDGDGANNLWEYGSDGDPTNAGRQGFLPVIGMGSNWFEYIYLERTNDNHGLLYAIEQTSDLIDQPWSNSVDAVVTGSGPAENSDFITVTNRIPTNGKTQEFLRLRIDRQ